MMARWEMQRVSEWWVVGELCFRVAPHQLMGVGVISTHFPGPFDADWLWAKHSLTLDSGQLTLSVFSR